MDQNLLLLDNMQLGFIKSTNVNPQNFMSQGGTNLLSNIALENIRVNAANEIKRIDIQLEKINQIGDDYEKLQYIGSTIPVLVEEGLPEELSKIEQILLELRSKYTEVDPLIIRTIEKRDLIIKLLKKRSIGYLEARKLDLNATIEAASRPKDVILKYKELLREASRDENTLIELENQLRIINLEEAKLEEPWQLITNPTILEDNVSPSLPKIGLLALFIGFISSTLMAYIRETKTKKIFDIDILEKLLNLNLVEIINTKNEKSKFDKFDSVREFINIQKNEKVNFVCIGHSQYSFMKELQSYLQDKIETKQINLFSSLEDIKISSEEIVLLIVDINKITFPKINKYIRYLKILEIKPEGFIVVE